MPNPITGNDQPNTLTGTTGDDAIYGYGATDHLYGLDGNDILDGGTGNDVMNGGAGNDTYYVDSSLDWIIDSSGTNGAFSSVSYSIVGENVSNLTLTGSSNLNATGNSLNNHIYGNSGNNVINGGVGADVMSGGKGNDIYYVDNPKDWIIESAGGGYDGVISSVSYALVGMLVERLQLTGTADLNATGNSLNNVLTGNSGDNILDGGGGADIMRGGAGDDTYYVDIGSDSPGRVDSVQEKAGEGNDTVISTGSYIMDDNIENLHLAGSGDYFATGNSVANVIVGNSGNNIIDGFGGADTLTGGAGNDIFQFDIGPDVKNVATITDFTVGQDILAFDRSAYVGFEDGPFTPSELAIGTAATTAQQHLIYNSGTGELFFDPDGNGSSAQVEIAKLTAGLPMTAASFTLSG